MSTYQHSEVFAKLKGITETIGTNLTSYQYLSSLDTFIYNAVYSMIDSTKYVDVFLAKVLAWQSANPKRKGSNVGKAALLNYITLFFLVDSTEKKLKILRQMKLDRGILSEMIRQFLNMTEPYERLMLKSELTSEDLELKARIEAQCCLRPSHSLYGVSRQTREWYAYSRKFKAMILEKYTRLCLNTAQNDYVALGHRVELDDIVQQYLLTAAKAIDKCDTDKGVLTTHIQNWLLNAKNIAASPNNGSTSFFPNALKTEQQRADKEAHLPVSIESLENTPVEEDDDSGDVIDRVRFIAKVFDPSGYGRLTLGIQELLPIDRRRQLHSHSVKLRAYSKADPETL